MNKSFTIFYSWQSSVGLDDNRKYIRNEIEKFKKHSNYDLIIDEATKYRAGSPDIVSTVMEKIGLADIFICDLTVVAVDNNGRGMPNSNVLFELGAAVSLLGWERIICVVNTYFGKIDMLPFDINHHRCLSYYKNDKDVRKPLKFTESIGIILANYDGIIGRFHENEWRRHDKELFEKFMKLCPEKELINSLYDCKMTHRFDGYNDKLWKTIIYFQRYSENFFINKNLNESFKLLSEVTDKMQTDFCLLFRNVYAGFKIEEPDQQYSQEDKDRILRTHIYKWREPSYPEIESEENIKDYYRKIDENIITINEDCNNVIDCFTKFRECVKRVLFI